MLREPQTPPTEPEPASPHELARGLQARAAQDLHDLEARYMAAFKLQAWWRRRRAAHVYTTKGAAFLKIIQRDTVRSLSWDVLTSRLSSEGTLELAQDLLSAVRISLQHHHRKKGADYDIQLSHAKTLLSAYVMLAEQETGDATPTTEPGTPKAEEDGAVAVPALLLVLAFEKMLRKRAGTSTCCPSTRQLDEFCAAAGVYERAFSSWKANDKVQLMAMLAYKLTELNSTLKSVRESSSGCGSSMDRTVLSASGSSKGTTFSGSSKGIEEREREQRGSSKGTTFSASPALRGQPLYNSEQRSCVLAELEAEREEIVQHVIRFGGDEFAHLLVATPYSYCCDQSEATPDHRQQQQQQSLASSVASPPPLDLAAPTATSTTPPEEGREEASETPLPPSPVWQPPCLPQPGDKERAAHEMMLDTLPPNEMERMQDQMTYQIRCAFWDDTRARLEGGDTLCAVQLFAELADGLKSLTPVRPSHPLYADIDAMLDVDLLRSQAEHDAVCVSHLRALALAAAMHVRRLEAPAYNEETDRFVEEVMRRLGNGGAGSLPADGTNTNTNTNTNNNNNDNNTCGLRLGVAADTASLPDTLVFVLRTLLDKIEVIKKGVVEYQKVHTVRPALEEHGATYERSAFNRRLASCGLTPSKLRAQAWVKGQWDADALSKPNCAGGKAQVTGTVQRATLALLSATDLLPEDLPETLEMDAERIFYMRDELQMATLTACGVALALQTYREAGSSKPATQPSPAWVSDFKEGVLEALLGGQLTVNEITEAMAARVNSFLPCPPECLERFRSAFRQAVVCTVRGGDLAAEAGPVLGLVKRRMHEELRLAVESEQGNVRPTSEMRFPVSLMANELTSVAQRAKQMVALNLAVHLPLYTQMLGC